MGSLGLGHWVEAEKLNTIVATFFCQIFMKLG